MNVAVFAVLAGYFTHILPEGLGASLRHRLGRLVPIYVLWTLVFLFVQFILKMVHHEGLAQYGQIGFWISVVFKGYGSGGYLWFIIALIYTQVMALFILRKPVSIVVPLMLAASGIGLSILMPYWNGHGHFMFRLFGFVWLGIAARFIWDLAAVWRGCAFCSHPACGPSKLGTSNAARFAGERAALSVCGTSPHMFRDATD